MNETNIPPQFEHAGQNVRDLAELRAIEAEVSGQFFASIGMAEKPVALHPRFSKIRNKRKRWREIRAIKRTGVACYLAPTIERVKE